MFWQKKTAIQQNHASDPCASISFLSVLFSLFTVNPMLACFCVLQFKLSSYSLCLFAILYQLYLSPQSLILIWLKSNCCCCFLLLLHCWEEIRLSFLRSGICFVEDNTNILNQFLYSLIPGWLFTFILFQ